MWVNGVGGGGETGGGGKGNTFPFLKCKGKMLVAEN